MEIELSIITVNYNGIFYTRRFLNSLLSYRKSDWEVIIVDNASQDNEAIILQLEYPWTICIRSEQNKGFSGGNNLGAEVAKGKYLFFVNNDVEFISDSITPLLTRLRQNLQIGAVSPQIKNPDGSYNYVGCAPLDKNLRYIHYYTECRDSVIIGEETPLIHGAAVMLPRKALERVGGWPELYFLYAEEVDLSLHLIDLGYKLWYEADAVLLHIGSCSTGKNSPMVCYYNSRNRLLLYKRNLKGWRRVYTIAYHLLVTVFHNSIIYLRRRQFLLLLSYWIGVKDFLLGNFGKRN